MALYQVTTTDNLAADVARLMMDLSQISMDKHARATDAGHDTPQGRGAEGQSHAYANAAMYLQDILDAHAAK